MKKFFQSVKEAFIDIFNWLKVRFKNFKWKPEYYGYCGYLVVAILLSLTGINIYFSVAAMGLLAGIEVFLIIMTKRREKEEEERVDDIISLIARKKLEENGGVLPEGELSPIDAATEEAITKHLRRYKQMFWLHMFVLCFAIVLILCVVFEWIGFDS